MRNGGGKQKGAGFEREVCVALSKWLSAGKRKDLLWRSAMSGGRATLGFRKGEKHLTQGGDISAIDPLGATLTDRYCIEIKFYKDLDLHAFWLGYGKLFRFWVRAQEDARKYNKEPMLIARQNQFDTLVILRFGSKLAGDPLWASRAYNVALSRFDLMVRRPYLASAVVERYQGKK